MKNLTVGLAACLVLCCAIAWGADEGEEQAGARLMVQLADGSRIVGTSTLKSLPLQAEAYGEIGMALEKVTLVTFKEDDRTAEIRLVNGDRLTARVDMTSLKLETLIGEVSIPLQHVTSIYVTGRGTPPLPGLVSWWPGDGNADDVVGGNHGLLHGDPNFVPGMVGDAFSLDGVDDYVEIRRPNLQPGPDGSFTLELWFKTAHDGPKNRGLVTHYGPTEPSVPLRPVPLFDIGLAGRSEKWPPAPPNHVHCYGLRSKMPLNDGAWHHVAASYDGPTKALAVYFDGQPSGAGRTARGQAYNAQLASVDWSLPLYFGNTFDRLYPVGLDEIRFYSRALAASEIKAIVEAARAPTESALFQISEARATAK